MSFCPVGRQFGRRAARFATQLGGEQVHNVHRLMERDLRDVVSSLGCEFRMLVVGARVKIDYYRILGVLSTATTADITTAYHLLVRKCHPDTGATDMSSLARIRLANEAYSVLSDETRRRAYDRDHRPHFSKAPNDACYRSCCGKETRSERGFDAELPVTPEEARYGGPCEFRLSTRQRCPDCIGRGQREGINCVRCLGQGMTLSEHLVCLTLPAGVKHGTVIRVPRNAPTQTHGGGHLTLRITIRPCW